MRTFILAAVIALGGVACYATGPEPVYATRTTSDRWVHGRVATLTDGMQVTVAQDQDGDLRIVEPYALRGRPVAVVNNDPDGDRPIVALIDESRWHHRGVQGSAGDVEHNYDRR